jgi:thiamine-monophosphate kinase
MSLSLNKEDYFISLLKKNKYNGDDGAVVGKYVYSMDAFCEDVHFKLEWLSLKQIAKKAMLINISDAVVMNAKPKFALLSIGIPKDFTKSQLNQLASGFNKIAKKYNIKIIGGDTISSDKLNINITLISKTKQPIYRKGLKNKDLLCYTNSLGSVNQDLQKLFLNKKISKKSKFITPKLHTKFFYEISSYIKVALDISDGLFFELERLSRANNLGFKFFYPINNKIKCSGEEYEILFGFDKKYLKTIKKIAKKHKIKLNIFAKATKGKFRSNCKNHHFG